MIYRGKRLTMSVHLIVSLGWLGAVLAYLALAVTGLVSRDAEVVRGAYGAMTLVGWAVIVPLSLAALVSGLVKSVDTPWGVLRYWWVCAKGVLTVGGIGVLLSHMQAVTRMSDLAMTTALSPTALRLERVQLVVHAVGGLLLLSGLTVLSVYKPWGLTPFGRRAGYAAPRVPAAIGALAAEPRGVGLRRAFRWQRVVGVHVVALSAALVLFHIASGGMRR